MPQPTERGPGTKAWQGRLPGTTDPLLEEFTSSLQGDLEMAVQDVAGSLAHAHELARAGLIDEAQLAALERGLGQVAAELREERFRALPSDEDIHMAVERRLTELVGEPGQRLHTGRSRNDQVALDLRLWCRSQICSLISELGDLEAVLLRRARRERATLLPGYTHLQRAQPISLGHHLLAYLEMLERDQGRLRDCEARTDRSPLGAAALSGSSLPLEPERTARELGFGSAFENSLDAVSDRDFVAELLFCSALLAIHLSRLAEDLVLWNSREFGFLRLPDRWATGSSIMPQKKNPDVLELVRGRSGRPLGALVGVLTLLKGLPLSYDRDLQEDRVHLFPALRSVRQSLGVLTALLAEVEFDRRRMAEAARDPELLATELAELLVRSGTPFRLAHGMVARLVREAEAKQLGLDQVALGAWQRLGLDSREEVEAVFNPEQALARRVQLGSPGARPLARELARAARAISGHRSFARSLRRRLPA